MAISTMESAGLREPQSRCKEACTSNISIPELKRLLSYFATCGRLCCE
jgi:hypothetical protein